MGVLVDYSCPSCLGRHEARVASPPPEFRRCPACGADAVRTWAPVGLVRRHQHSENSARDATVHLQPPLCATNPDVPGLCHMSEDTARMWLARARKDNRAIEREMQRQEHSVRAGATPSLDAVVSNGHAHHSHGADHEHGQGWRV